MIQEESYTAVNKMKRAKNHDCRIENRTKSLLLLGGVDTRKSKKLGGEFGLVSEEKKNCVFGGVCFSTMMSKRAKEK